MNWNAIGALAEIIGAVAVVVSLLYLGRQVALANRLAKAEAWRSRHAELTTLNAAFGVDPRFHRAMVKAYSGAMPPDLEEDEVSLVSSYSLSVSMVFGQLHREVSEGLLDERALDAFVGEGSVFQIPYYRAGWAFHRSVLDPAFVAWVEERHKLSVPNAPIA